jgi:hypothetical protein
MISKSKLKKRLTAAVRARTVSLVVATNKTGALTTAGGLNLKAPVAYAKTSGDANLTINPTTGAISAAAALAAGASQTLVGKVTGADGVVIPITVTLTGGVVLAALGLSPLNATVGATWTATITGLTAGSSVQATSSDGAPLTVTGSTVSGVFAAPGTPTITLTESLGAAVNSPSISTFGVSVADATTIPANVVTYQGQPVTYNGDYVTYTPAAGPPANVVTYQGQPVTYNGDYVTYTPLAA